MCWGCVLLGYHPVAARRSFPSYFKCASTFASAHILTQVRKYASAQMPKCASTKMRKYMRKCASTTQLHNCASMQVLQ